MYLLGAESPTLINQFSNGHFCTLALNISHMYSPYNFEIYCLLKFGSVDVPTDCCKFLI